MELREISIDQIDEPSYIVRLSISTEELEELASSIQAVGVKIPLRVFNKDGRYEIEDGHRRYLAAKMVGFQVLPCLVVDDEEEEREFTKLHTGLHSTQLTPIELSINLNYFKDRFDLTHEELAKIMGRSVSRVSQLLALIHLDPNLVEAMKQRYISEAAARLLQQIPDPERRTYYIQYIKDGGASLDMVRSWVAQEKVWDETPAPPPELLETRAPDVPITYPVQRCVCCREQVRTDRLYTLKVCPKCIDDLNQVLPSIYQAMQIEREEEEQVETVDHSKEVLI